MDGSQLSFPDDSFDTVVQTYGICSHEHPEDTLKEMARVCKPTGKILLLEHGRSKWRLVNWYLDRNREQHEEKWGCTWNKDINQILHDSGLELEETRVNLLGTNFYYVAHPAREE
jgi:methyltransferase OMS1